ncbi:enhanced filamentous growth protein [Candida albicans P75016]|nr:enhanced filamentous growth protein [Candida albicans 12C]KGU01778.1 enhanced filamentous growth protein [Candida albicans 19F]KHC60007.1 enhanced filamentous growth protein [Candida albicans P75016]
MLANSNSKQSLRQSQSQSNSLITTCSISNKDNQVNRSDRQQDNNNNSSSSSNNMITIPTTDISISPQHLKETITSKQFLINCHSHNLSITMDLIVITQVLLVVPPYLPILPVDLHNSHHYQVNKQYLSHHMYRQCNNQLSFRIR